MGAATEVKAAMSDLHKELVSAVHGTKFPAAGGRATVIQGREVDGSHAMAAVWTERWKDGAVKTWYSHGFSENSARQIAADDELFKAFTVDYFEVLPETLDAATEILRVHLVG